MSIDCGIVEILVSHQDPNGTWLLMGRQYCFNGFETISLKCVECPSELVHFIVDKDGTTAYLREDYGVIIDSFKEEAKRDRQKYALYEMTGKDETKDFIGRAKEVLGIDIWKTTADIATNDDIEKALGYK